MFDTIFNYLTQVSTWKGIVGLATAGGVAISPELGAQIVATGMAVVGLINVFRNERKAK